MRVRIVALFVYLFSFQCFGICQNSLNGCDEKPGSPQKLFVFIGELIQAEAVPARTNVNEARFSATYRIIERICGSYQGDIICFGVIQVVSDSTFKKNKYQLLMLTKDTAQDGEYKLWADLYFDLFKTVNSQWVASYTSKNDILYKGEEKMVPKKIRFSKDAFFDTRGLTREEIDITYPEPFYKIKKDKAIPILGNTISEIFRHQKEGTLARANIYDLPAMQVDTTNAGVVVQDVQFEEIEEVDPDSAKQVLENAYQAIKDSLVKDPFSESKIQRLLQNCRNRNDYGNCLQFFENLVHDYPESVKAYLLQAKFSCLRASLEDSSVISVLQQALKMDSNSYEANYELALSYYRLFRQQSNASYAFAARKWFIRCMKINVAERGLLKYPVIQLCQLPE